MILLPPDNVVSLDDYRRKRPKPEPLDVCSFDVAGIRREWDLVTEAAGCGDLDSAA